MKRYKPTTPGRRKMTAVEYRKVLTTDKPNKSLTSGRKRSKGRNSKGRITIRHKGGGNKRKWREIDFKYDKKDILAKVESIEYDPNRTGFVALVCYADGERRYVLAPKGLKVGASFLVSENAPLVLGNRLPLSKIPAGTFVFNVEINSGAGSRLARSAGNFAQVLGNDEGVTTLKMPSSEVRKVNSGAWASIGEVSNSEHSLEVLGKAGRSRQRGIRPTVRGSAMNPVDHPHGGGEGRQGIGLRRGPKTPWGKQALGVKTRKAKKYSNNFIVSRRNKGKRGK